MEKRLDFFQDQQARFAIETQALQQSLGFLINMGTKIATEEVARMSKPMDGAGTG